MRGTPILPDRGYPHPRSEWRVPYPRLGHRRYSHPGSGWGYPGVSPVKRLDRHTPTPTSGLDGCTPSLGLDGGGYPPSGLDMVPPCPHQGIEQQSEHLLTWQVVCLLRSRRRTLLFVFCYFLVFVPRLPLQPNFWKHSLLTLNDISWIFKLRNFSCRRLQCSLSFWTVRGSWCSSFLIPSSSMRGTTIKTLSSVNDN